MTNTYELKGKRVLVTGAAGQIGRELVLAYVKNGAFVYVVDMAETLDAEYVTKLSEHEGQYHYISGNIARPESIQEIMIAVGEPLDVLVNCAGIGVYTPFEQRTEEELDEVMATNLKGTILLTKAVAEGMKEQKSGTIISFGSIYGITTPDFRIYGDSGRNSSEIYGATKAGIIHFMHYLAAYLAPYGITSNAISPGGVYRSQAPFFVEGYERKTPLARMASPEDLLGTILFLSTSDARYITGQNIAVDGGFTVW